MTNQKLKKTRVDGALDSPQKGVLWFTYPHSRGSVGKHSLLGTFGKEWNVCTKNEHVKNKGRNQNKKMIGSSDRKMGSQKKRQTTCLIEAAKRTYETPVKATALKKHPSKASTKNVGKT